MRAGGYGDSHTPLLLFQGEEGRGSERDHLFPETTCSPREQGGGSHNPFSHLENGGIALFPRPTQAKCEVRGNCIPERALLIALKAGGWF